VQYSPDQASAASKDIHGPAGSRVPWKPPLTEYTTSAHQKDMLEQESKGGAMRTHRLPVHSEYRAAARKPPPTAASQPPHGLSQPAPRDGTYGATRGPGACASTYCSLHCCDCPPLPATAIAQDHVAPPVATPRSAAITARSCRWQHPHIGGQGGAQWYAPGCRSASQT
jgi:hypothetical protein